MVFSETNLRVVLAEWYPSKRLTELHLGDENLQSTPVNKNKTIKNGSNSKGYSSQNVYDRTVCANCSAQKAVGTKLA